MVYAKALAEVLSKKRSVNEEKKIVQNFLLLLEKRGGMSNAKVIVSQAEMMMLKNKGNKKITLETARKIELKKMIKGLVKTGDTVEEKINPSLVAGIKVIVDGEQQLDFSLAKKLNEIFQS